MKNQNTPTGFVEKSWTTKSGLKAVAYHNNPLMSIAQIRQFNSKCNCPMSETGTMALGWKCGYVGVKKNNILHKVGYSEEAEVHQDMANGAVLGTKSPVLAFTCNIINGQTSERVRKSPDVLIDVHGGITYSGPLLPWKNGVGLWSVMRDFFSRRWWFGFDCNHYNDTENPKSLKFVIGECERMASQLAEFNQ